MARKRGLPNAYSGGFLSTIESAGAGSSDHRNSSATSNKRMKSSSELPVQVVPLHNIPSDEKNKWLLKLRTELDKVTTFQKRLDLHCQKVKKGTFTLVLRKQCDNLLKKLMSRQHGWMFSKPVDIDEFGIPDYYDVIKHPMDLGTIKEKLGLGKYSSPVDFLADVRLTFTNAMTYNPPGNQVHAMADTLSMFFEKNWKPIEKKLHVNVPQQEKVLEEMDLEKVTPLSKESKVTMVMSNEEKHNVRRDLEVHMENLPDNIVEFLSEHASNGNETGEDEIEVDIEVLDNDSLLKLRKMLDEHVQNEGNHTQVESSVIDE